MTRTDLKATTGVEGLDDILVGGLRRGRVYLLEGTPGTGKTTIASQFLLEGAKRGESGLYITLSETEAELRETMQSHEWAFEGPVQIFELVPPESLLDDEQQQSLLYSSDLELGETTQRIFEAIEQHNPQRVVLDSLSEIRLLAQSSLRYRRQVLALKHYFARHDSTVLMLDDLTTETLDKTVHSVAHGVIRLEETAPDYGAERRRLRVVKYRGQSFRGGYHDMVIQTGGVRVFPRLVSAEHHTDFERAMVGSNNPALDKLLGGGIERGSSTLVIGPAGTGKSLLTLTFAVQAIERGEKAALFIFDEELGVLFERAKGLGFDLEAMRDSGNLLIEQVDAAEMSPGEFSQRVRNCVQSLGARTVVIDSLNGYQQAMPDEKQLILHMHELLQFLNRQGAATFLTVAQHGLVGDMRSPVDVTYLADTVILLRYFEAAGRVRRAISIIKKRTGAHEDTIREYRIGAQGVTLGEPLTNFQGVLRGIPELLATEQLADPPKPNHTERALILAPTGRDSVIAAGVLAEARIRSIVCGSAESLLCELDHGAGFVVATEEALLGADLRPLAEWIARQPEWSDLPFVLLTHRGGGLERNPEAARFLQALGNVTFLERPFHPTTLISLGQSALRGRRRQYEARARLEALQESEDHFRHTVELNPQIAWTASPDGKLEQIAPRWAQWTGRSELDPPWEDVIHPEDLEATIAAWGHSFATGAHFDVECRVRMKEGGYHWMHSRAKPRRSAAGQVVRWYGTTEDIDQRKAVEEDLRHSQAELQRANETLEARVEDRTRERESALAKLHEAQKLETLGQLTGGVAHDFNNLLTPVIGNLDLLRRRIPETEKSHRLIDGALQAASRASTLVQRLLAFARRQDLQPRAVETAALIEGMSDLLKRSIGPTIDVRVDSEPGLPPSRVDPNQLELAILNLAINARDAMPSGGTLRIESRSAHVATPGRVQPGDYVCITVRDTGLGMSPDTLARAIEPFFSTKGVGHGTGLGLSMVHGLAAQLGGMLDLSSEPNVGTSATIWLPVSRDVPKTIDGGEIPLTRAAQRATILLVDDEELVRTGTAEMLSDLGYEVIEASSGAEALRLLRSGVEPDLLITDFLMPGMNGVALLEHSTTIIPNMNVLLITGYSTIAEGPGAKYPRLGKPYRQAELSRRVAEALGRKSDGDVLPFHKPERSARGD